MGIMEIHLELLQGEIRGASLCPDGSQSTHDSVVEMTMISFKLTYNDLFQKPVIKLVVNLL